MKKLLSYLLVIALVLVQFMPLVSAATTGSITINTPKENTENGDVTYDIYKIFDLSYDDTTKAYRYTIDSETSLWWNFVRPADAANNVEAGEGSSSVNLEKSVGSEYVVTMTIQKDSPEIKTFAEKALAYAETNNIQPNTTATIEKGGTTTTESGLSLGYYLVDSSMGALVALTSTDYNATINEKNGIPVVDKGVQEDSNSEGTYGDNNTADIGQTVKFKTTIAAQAGAENYVLYDIMDSGLTLDQTSIEVKKNNETLTEGTDYTVSFDTNGYTFVIDFDSDLEYGLTDEDVLTVTYEATVNAGATVNGTGNVNETYLKYGDNNETTHDKTRTYTFSFDLNKKTSDGESLIELDGAEFSLYKSSTGGEAIELVELKDAQNNVIGYRVATEDDTNKTTTIKVGSTVIVGLDEDVYYLEETKAPEGYNKLTSRVAVNVDATIDSETFESTVVVNNTDIENVVDYAGDTVNVINTTGSLLPSTGGMGTVLFITVGSIMVLGFGVLLVTKLRISKMEI